MRINSIRTKVILPIAFLALILAGLLVSIASITYIQDNAMKRQTETFFEAVTVILNATETYTKHVLHWKIYSVPQAIMRPIKQSF